MITLVLLGFPLSLVDLAYTRYLVIGELMSGLAFLCLLEATLTWRGPRTRTVMAIAAALMLASSYTQSWGTVPLAESWFRVRIADPPRHALILVVGEQGFQYVLPSLPPSNRFGAIGQGDSAFAAADRRFAREVQSFTGDVFLLSPSFQRALLIDPVLKDLRRFGLTFVDGRCTRVEAVTGPVWLCRLERTAE